MTFTLCGSTKGRSSEGQMEGKMEKIDHGKRGVVWMEGRKVIAKARPVSGAAGGWIVSIYTGAKPWPPSPVLRTTAPQNRAHAASKRDAVAAIEAALESEA